MISNQTEKDFRDKQNRFGHLDNGLEVRDWLASVYSPNNFSKKRYLVAVSDLLLGRENLKVLELGAGIGDLTGLCQKYFPDNDYYASDLSLDQLNNNYGAVMSFFGVTEPARLLSFSAEDMPLEDNYFDLVMIKASVHHFENPYKSFKEINRILKPGGRVVFLEDPICFNIPFYRSWKKKNFCAAERALGINEHIYTIRDYLSFGEMFSRRSFAVNRALEEEFHQQGVNRRGLKLMLLKIISWFDPTFRWYMIYRFVCPLVFVFEK